MSIFTSVDSLLRTILSEHKKSLNKRRELCTINMTGTVTRWLVICCLDAAVFSVKEDNGKPTMSLMKSDEAVNFSVTKFCLFSLTGFMISKWTWALPSRVCLELYWMCELLKNQMLCLEHELWVLHFNPAQLQFCCKFPKLARFILKARAGQLACCLSSFFRLPCRGKWRKYSFKDNGISDADILSFRDRLEIDLKQKNMWEQLKSGKSHTILCTWNKRVSDIVFHHWMAGIPG